MSLSKNAVVINIRKDKAQYQKSLVRKMKRSPKMFYTVTFEVSKEMMFLWLQFAIQNVDYLQMTRNKPDFVWSVSASLCQPGICGLVQSCSKFSWWSVCWGSVYWGYCLQEVVHTKCFKVTRTRQYTSSFVKKNCADLLPVPLMYIFQDISGQFFTWYLEISYCDSSV